MGRFDALTQLETSQPKTTVNADDRPKDRKASLLANQQTSLPANQQTDLSVNQHTSKEANEQTSLPANQQTSKLALSTKEKKKYGTYLRPDSIMEIKIRAAKAMKKDHDFLQDIVDFYFERVKN